MCQELEALRLRISDNTVQILAAKVCTQSVQKGVSILSKQIDEVNKAMAARTTSLKSVPSKGELQLHAHTMEEQIERVAEINTGLTTAKEECKFSESLPYNVRISDTVVGPAGTQHVHPERQAAFNQQSPSVSSLKDTGSEYSWHTRFWGGAESNA
jgi:hypothetical protein